MSLEALQNAGVCACTLPTEVMIKSHLTDFGDNAKLYMFATQFDVHPLCESLPFHNPVHILAYSF